MSKLAALAGLLVLGAVVLSACGGGDSEGDSSGRASGVPGVPDGAPFIDQDNLKFIPTSVTAYIGEVIYFKNSESAIHTVTIDGKNQSGEMRSQEVFKWTPTGAGTFKITCDFHPQMKATVTVKEGTPPVSEGDKKSQG